MTRVLLLLSSLSGVALADIVLSRTVNSLPAGSGNLTIEGSACSKKADYGSNAVR